MKALTTSLSGALVMLCGCGGSNSQADHSVDDSQMVVDTQIEQQLAPVLTDDEVVKVCRAGHGFSVGREPSDMTASLASDGLVRIAYTRDDGKAFRYDCKIEGRTIRTRMIDERGPGTGPGAWSGRGSRSTFVIDNTSITIREVYFDGSSDEETYPF